MTILGFKSPFQKGSTSFPAQSTDDDVIRDNIIRILMTMKGSRVMRPNIGSEAWGFIFENKGPLLRARIDNDVRRALAFGEPRVTVVMVTAKDKVLATGQELVIVEITYMVNGNMSQVAVPYVKP